ncbi:beta-galactosidase-like protein [Sphingomonas sp. PP-F2F-A104-K0414]|uniref:beta-galactosidase trimerization domain-containing protein n=1 Tax=Sphingomonas sp. PP-F2F-A104-K0414 TaxID=2135661 RepID=UPI0010EAF55A|nr:beta-galactosidase trimerization domain-containing protein [Sphingomonas sp. PP-F2F-A104-K0414]TCP96678.1 beta-galactosidase-like protein [Sphingomonas sp. PP-F2F-A104-K0414]
MDKETAEAVRRYVANGGTVIMTGYSAKVDETGKWFETPLPGRLTDVFGVRTNEFYRAEQPLKIMFDCKEQTGSDPFYEVLEPSTAKPLAMFTNTPKPSPAVTVNRFGKGRAIYLATAAQGAFPDPLVRSLYTELGIERGPVTPPGVVARVVDGRTLYVNTNTAPARVALAGKQHDILSGRASTDRLDLPPYGVALLQ